MATQNTLIRTLLRIVTPEEIADIATKHNGGKFLSLTDLVTERIEHNVSHDFSNPDIIDEIHEAYSKDKSEDTQAKILPFTNHSNLTPAQSSINEASSNNEEKKVLFKSALKVKAITTAQEIIEEDVVEVKHKENENMSSFILVEKARLNKSQKVLKQKEIIDLYQKNSNVDVEHIKTTNSNPASSSEAGVLVNKKQY